MYRPHNRKPNTAKSNEGTSAALLKRRGRICTALRARNSIRNAGSGVLTTNKECVFDMHGGMLPII
jgi:hypothetical protein